jgi:pyrimidine deaminase RibD-like protein
LAAVVLAGRKAMLAQKVKIVLLVRLRRSVVEQAGMPTMQTSPSPMVGRVVARQVQVVGRQVQQPKRVRQAEQVTASAAALKTMGRLEVLLVAAVAVLVLLVAVARLALVVLTL